MALDPGFLLSNSVVRFISILKNGHHAGLLGVTREDGNVAPEHTDLRKSKPKEGRVGVRLKSGCLSHRVSGGSEDSLWVVMK